VHGHHHSDDDSHGSHGTSKVPPYCVLAAGHRTTAGGRRRCPLPVPQYGAHARLSAGTGCEPPCVPCSVTSVAVKYTVRNHCHAR
jgi:hypothetical protein